MTLLEQSNDLLLLSEFPLLPCGPTTKVPSGKAPIDPETGFNLSKWEGTAYTPEDLLNLNGSSNCVTSVGINHALSYRDGFCNIDLDGLSTLDKAKEFGCSSTQPGWIIGRDTTDERLKVPFYIPEDLRHHFDDFNGNPVGKVVLTTKPAEYDLDADGKPKRDADGKLIKLKDSEQIELFWATGQTVVLGQHIPSGGQYTWKGNPTATGEPTPEWWEFILHILEEGQKQSKPQKSNNNSAEVIQSGPGEPCVICGRDTSGACTKYTDGERVRINCFEGQTFNPIDTHGTLTNGQTIEGSDGKTYACCGSGFNGSIGSFAKFIEHVELPKQKLSKKSSDTDSPHDISDEDESPEEYVERRVGELLDLRLTTEDTWAEEMVAIADLTCRQVKRPDVEQRMYKLLADRWNLAISQNHSNKRQRRGANQTREGEQQQMLVHGFLPWKRDSVLFGPGGVGKTTAAIGLAWSVITGEPFLDHEIEAKITGKVLFIGSDGGIGAYDMWQNTAEDLGFANDQRWIDGCFFWGADEQEGTGAWSATPAGLLELKEELESGDYAAVIIDSWKAILELADIDFGIGPVGTIIRLLQALIGKHCSALYLHHPSGNARGKGIGGSGGNQNVNQIPFAVHELRVEPASDDKPSCVRWLAHKLRGYQNREFLYRLGDEGLHVFEGDVFTNCRDALLDTIGTHEEMGTATTTPAIKNALSQIKGSTISNNLTRMRQSKLLKKSGSNWHLSTRGKVEKNRLYKRGGT